MKTLAIRTIGVLLMMVLAAFAVQAAESVSTLVYEGFSASASGAGDDYQINFTLRNATDVRTGFATNAWGDPLVALGLDYTVRSSNMVYENFITGTGGALEIYESRTGKARASRAILRSLSYATPDTNDIFFVFGWATADAAPVSLSLSGSFPLLITVTDAGKVTVNFGGANSSDYTSTNGAAATDGSWNLLIIRAMDDPGGEDPAYYDTAAIWVNPTIASGKGEISQLGASSGLGDGIIREQVSGTPTSFTIVTFGASVGTGDEVQFDEFHITTDPSDFLMGASAVTGTLFLFE